MDLANRIKSARLAAGLSQRQLCGDTVTRNMLSLIESGKARPSMATLQHFSAVLGKPLSYFLEEDAVTSPNQQRMQAAQAAFAAGDFSAALTALADYCAPDGVFDETRYLLELLCCEKLAETAIAENKKAYALELLDRADALAEQTIFAPDARRRTLLRCRVNSKSAAQAQLSVTAELLVKAYQCILAADYPRAIRLLEAVDAQSTPWYLLRGIAAFHTEDYAVARQCLCAAEATYPRQALPLLEQTCLKLNDYRSAYEYAKKQASVSDA